MHLTVICVYAQDTTELSHNELAGILHCQKEAHQYEEAEAPAVL